MKNIFIIGSKGIPAKYGGFETFVEELTANQINKEIKYHVACLSDNRNEIIYNNARCFNVKVPNIGPAKAVYYDIATLKNVIEYIENNDLNDCIVYILACRIGPFIAYFKRKLHRMEAKLYVNPDGHEWKRAKWNYFIKKYWKYSEKLMIKHCDLAICDSIGIEDYIKETYKKYNPKTTYIAYGATLNHDELNNDQNAQDWFSKYEIKENNYYLIVGRFVPENNFEIMIKEFMKANTSKDLVIITNVENNKFYDKLKVNTHFQSDSRIKFVGTVYDDKLLTIIRSQAYAYIHGHSVGGTNPSLLEAMATTNINLLLNVNFNIEVGDKAAIYWGKQENSLANIINAVDVFSSDYVKKLGTEAKNIIIEKYSWDKIINEYESLFLQSDK
ncbi:beta 1-4 rhamnosyltransferase Cps2T [Thomasclavelia ramosa]|uniref:beta 1-4 rhamnosyltransferase Cps2T n=1 Tax=Thomasclavelia ramosa TaxID=1547 RepID=UPI001F20FC6A|nr:DUF1972 domain-containing protein [Thomasclavelia ramosa]MCR1957768.1 DUF1972 domain-containing protein [Thomasclavelia ramosa]